MEKSSLSIYKDLHDETHNYFASVFNNGRMVDGGDLPIDFRTNAIIGPNVQFLNKGKETYWHFLTSS